MGILPQEQIQFYRKNGFVQVDNLLSADEVEELREYMEESMEAEGELSIQNSKDRGAYSRVLNQKVNNWRDHAGMAKYCLHPRFAAIALELTGATGIRFFHDHILWKMPQDSKPTPWHQDFPYWPMNESGALSIWIALDDVDEQNGCMMFIPKSQEVGKLSAISLAEPQNIFDLVEGEAVKNENPVICRLKAGSATFHNGLTFHYAHANQTDRPRRALAIIYFPDGTTYSGKKHVVADPSGLTPGQPIRGRFFPLLVKENSTHQR